MAYTVTHYHSLQPILPLMHPCAVQIRLRMFAKVRLPINHSLPKLKKGESDLYGLSS